ncbi:MAG TPA: cyclic nucleotide-binding domain-containing protein [Myxococcales bacterium]|nr:cyclic nucleotide-binding domain-containing protein [Myxococcales bacterium]
MDVNELAKVSKIFEALDASGRARLLTFSKRAHAAPGEVICREGDPGGEFFVISAGEVRVSCSTIDGGEKELAVLHTGQFFGEMAALNGDKRMATCTAVADVELIAFPTVAVERVLSEYPAARAALNRVGVLRSDAILNKMME